MDHQANSPHTSLNPHVVLGAGQIGPLVAAELLAAGVPVRVVSRTDRGNLPSGAEFVAADLMDVEQTAAACAGAAAIYECTNPTRYDRWDEELPRLRHAALRAARATGARLVCLDNLYMHSLEDGAPLREDTPPSPCASKGRLRARLAEEALAARAAGEVDVSFGRAADFFGPGTSTHSLLGTPTIERIARGQRVPVFGDIDLPRAYSYAPDVARGLAAIGLATGAVDAIYHLPTAAQVTTRELLQRFAEESGATLRTLRVGDWLLRLLGLFNGEAREVVEMTYQWQRPYRVDSSRFETRFRFGATPLEQAVRETVATVTPVGLLPAQA